MGNTPHRQRRAAKELDHLTIQPHRHNRDNSRTCGQRGPTIQPAATSAEPFNPNHTQARSRLVDQDG